MPSIKELKKYALWMNCKRDTYVYSWIVNAYVWIGLYLTKLLLYTPITANHVTFFMLLIGIVGGVFFALGELWSLIVGFLMFVLIGIFDQIDGTIARYKNSVSIRGVYIDIIHHYTSYLAMDVGLVVAAYRMTGNVIVLMLGSVMILSNLLTKMTLLGYNDLMSKKEKILEQNRLIIEKAR